MFQPRRQGVQIAANTFKFHTECSALSSQAVEDWLHIMMAVLQKALLQMISENSCSVYGVR